MATLTWLLPVATFAIGLLIGFAVWNTGGGSGGTNQAGPTTSAPATTAQTSASAGATVTVSVPQSCLDAVTESQQSLDLLNQATQAIADLDAARLQTIVDQLQTAAQRIQTLGDDCRASADVVVTPSSVLPTS